MKKKREINSMYKAKFYFSVGLKLSIARMFIVCVSLFLFLTQLPALSWGDALAVGRMGTASDTSYFVNRRGSGSNCVSVIAGPVVNPGPGAPCSFGVDFYTVNGKGNTAFKNPPSTTSTFTNTATGGTPPRTATGTASWTYTFGRLIDTATYSATSTIIGPLPTTVIPNTFARALARDPVEFDASDPGIFGYAATMPELQLFINEPTGSAGVGADAQFDGTTIFDFHLIAPAGFTSITDLDLMYISVLGPAFDAIKEAEILANLSVNPSLGSVTMINPLNLFPRTEFSFAQGSHSFGGGFVAAVEAVPEPSTLLLLVSGIVLLGRCGRFTKNRGSKTTIIN